jgi:membrane protein
MAGRIDAYQQRHRWAGLPLAVLYKFADDQGTYLAAQITYYGFVALFPLLLLLATILGYALHGKPAPTRPARAAGMSAGCGAAARSCRG